MRRGTGFSRIFTALAAAAAAFVVLPLAALVIRAPWGDAADVLAAPGAGAALRLSLLTSTAAVVLAALLGTPLAWLLARRDFPGRGVLRTVCLLPMVLPPVVGGVALLLAFGRRGLVGPPLEGVLGVSLPFTAAGVVVAQTFVSMPFLVVTVEAGLRALDQRYEAAAATLGAGPWTSFRRVTLPRLWPALGAGAALCWARALGEFGATITFAGNMPGRTQTMPLAVYLELQTRPELAVLLSLLLLVLSAAVFLLVRGVVPGGGRS